MNTKLDRIARAIGLGALLAMALLAAACKSGGGGGNNGKPIAILSAENSSGTAPLTVNFDASASADDGDIVLYDWDWDGDGTFDDNTTNPRTSHIYPAAGSFLVRMRVTDNDGNTATDTVSVHVLSGNWHIQPLDTVGNAGAYTSAAIINGKPAIAYQDVSAQRLKYVIAASPAGTSWGVPLTVVPGARSGLQASLAQVADRPAIAYINDVAGQVEYVRALDPDGDSWDGPVDVGVSSTILDVRLLEADGNPAVAFADVGNGSDGEAVFIRASDQAGTDWTGGLLVDDVGEDVSALDAAIVDGVPAAAYVEEASDDLRFVQARDRDGGSWFLPLDAVETGVVGNMISMAVIGGRPAVSYLDASGADGDLYYVRAVDADGVQWGAPVPVDISGLSTGQHSSLAEIGGRPAIAFYNLSSGRLEYVEAGDADGDVWGTPMIVDQSGAVGLYTSLIDVDGSPGISYYDSTHGDLKWAILQ